MKGYFYYRKIKDTIEATGTEFIYSDSFYYTAGNKDGLWLSGTIFNEQPLIIGFIKWQQIEYAVLDEKNERVFIVLKDYKSVVKKYSPLFKLQEKNITHIMKKTGLKAFCLPLELFNKYMLGYIALKVPLLTEEEEITPKSNFLSILITIIIILALLACILFYFLWYTELL